jgi:hypothetical protein
METRGRMEERKVKRGSEGRVEERREDGGETSEGERAK